MKSFNLNNAMREELAKTITTQAVQAELLKWAAEVSRINDLFWENHCQKVIETGLKKNLWDGLIQKDIVNSIYRVKPHLEFRGRNDTYHSDVVLMDSTEKGLWNKAVKTSAITDAGTWFSELNYRSVSLMFKSKKSVPTIKGVGTIDMGDEMQEPIIAAKEWFRKIYQAAIQCYRQTMAVLSSCRTSRQLENIFPEAAKMLPQPEKKITNEVAPVELIANIQTMLKSGISTNK